MFNTELQAMRNEMEEKIRAQLMANQQLLGDSEKTWDEKVRSRKSYCNFVDSNHTQESKCNMT